MLGVATLPDWVPLLAPFAGVLIAAIGLYAAFHPWIQERRTKEAEAIHQIERGENAINLIFGVEEDKRRGILPQQGILDRLQDHTEKLERLADIIGVDREVRGLDPSKSIMEMLADNNADRKENWRVTNAVQDDLRKLREHDIRQDERDRPHAD